MKKSILLSAIVGALLLSTGCGSDGDSTVNPEDIVIKYTTDGTYDISNYIVAAQTQSNNYVHTTYTNDKGDKKYDDTPDSTTYSTTRYENNSTNIVLVYKDNVLDTTYDIQTDRILAKINETSTTTLARYADKGSYISKTVQNYTEENGNNLTDVALCKVNKHITSQEINGKTYNDILEVVCNTSASTPEGSTINGVPYSYAIERETTSLFAKSQGMISEIIEACTDVTVNTTTDSTCEKKVTQITTIN